MAPKPLSIVEEAVRLTAGLAAPNKTEAGRVLEEHFGIKEKTVRSSLYGMEPHDMASRIAELLKDPGGVSNVDHKVAIAKVERTLDGVRKENRDLVRALESARAIRTDIFGISDPITPEMLTVPDRGEPQGLTWIINLFDNHLGKRFGAHEVQGLQDYDVAIAKNRIMRTFQQAIMMINRYGEPVERIIVVCGGDNVNGELRRDDTRSNELDCASQSREFAESASSGIVTLTEAFPEAAIDVLVLPGNHGRTAPNPPSVELGENWDCVAGMLMEATMKDVHNVSVSNSGVADAVINIYGRSYLFTHGDRIGARGGDGIIGALGPTRRGALRMYDQYAKRRQFVPDLPPLASVVMGHWHVHWTDRRVFVSGAACGPDPWAMQALRAEPCPPWQWMLGVHPTKGIIQDVTLFIGHPDEGPICCDLTFD